MTKVEGEDGWYSYTIKNMDQAKVLFNDGGSEQIPGRNEEGFLVSGEKWYKDGTWSNQKPDDIVIHFYKPRRWSSAKLYYYKSTQVSGPSWPGEAMTIEKEDEGWYTFTIKKWNEAKVIFNNGGSEQIPERNEEGFVISGEKWYKDGTWFDERPDDIVIHFYKPQDWNAPNLYYYKTEQDTGPAWPGTKMEQEIDNWYYLIIPDYNKAKVLFNDGVRQIPARLAEGFELTNEMWYKDGVWYADDPDGDKIWLDEDEEYTSQVDADYDNLDITYAENDCFQCVTQNITLPTKGVYESIITWQSNTPSVLSNTGVVNRPDGESKEVILTATITDGIHTKTKEFEVKVAKKFVEINLTDNHDQELMQLNEGELPEMYVDENGALTYLYGSYTNYKVETPEEAIHSLNSMKSFLKIQDPQKEFELTDISADEFNVEYRFQQIYNGLRVGRNEILLTSELDGEPSSLISSYLYNISDGFDITPAVSQANAEGIAQNEHTGTYEIYNSELFLYTEEDTPILAWEITMEGIDDISSYDGYRIILNAKTGDILEDETTTSNVKQVTITGKNYKREEKKLSGADLNLGEQKKEMSQRYALYDIARNIKVYSAEETSIIRKLVSSKTKKFSSKEIDITTFHNIKKVYDYYVKNFNRKSFNNKGMKINVVTHYRKNYTNAQFNETTKELRFGDGNYTVATDKAQYPLGIALDVVGHEFTHAVIYYRVKGLKNSGIEGAIGEAYGDIIGNFIENRKGDPDLEWTIAEDATVNGLGVRDMNNPDWYSCSKVVGDAFWRNTTNTNENNDYGGIHSNSTVLSHAACLMYQRNVGTKTTLAKLWYKSMASLKSKADSPTFVDVRVAVVTAARNMKLSSSKIESIRQAFNEVGVGPQQGIYKGFSMKEKGSLLGSVSEYDVKEVNCIGKGLKDVTITLQQLENAEDARTIITDAQGEYQIDDIEVGNYVAVRIKCIYSSSNMYLYLNGIRRDRSRL